MARKLRVWYPRAVYHIMCRGNHRHSIFRDDQDRQVYLSMLRQVMEIHPFQLYSYCLMTNHVHFQLATGDVAPGVIMKKLNMKYAIFFNKKYRFVGQLLQGRYRAEIIDSDHYCLEISRYIHLNPVKAGMVSHPIEYPWSSYNDYIDYTPMVLTKPDKILDYFSEPRVEQYVKFVEAGIISNPFTDIPTDLLLDDGEDAMADGAEPEGIERGESV